METGLENLTDEELKELNIYCSNLNSRSLGVLAHGVDYKFAYHVVRLVLEAEQILIEHDLNIEQNSEILKSIRRGEWSLEKIQEWFNVKERVLESIYATSTLRHAPDQDSIKRLLVECLEDHYGSLDNAVVLETDGDALAKEMFALLGKYGYN